MNDVIRLLPDSVANQIAAGEVIQQPSSVVKELVENAVDAGAKHISIILKDAGRTLIQVVDDGCGMSETDARLAFERHATSKIKAALDLFSLRTMGFRGEALASIAAVAQVELRTRRESDPVGTRLEISGSSVVSQQPDGCPVGSNMAVKNLFFNVPARRKFLKKDSVEFGNVVKEFERLALVNPGIDLTLVHNDVTVHRLGPAGMKQRIVDLFGRSLSGQLIPVDTDTSLVKISGYICRPENARRKGALQFLTVNGRNMRHPVFQKAVMQCYEELIAHDAKPNYFIDFHVDPETIDVNIHPTKNEIKFENELAIRQILVAAIRESMGKFNVMPAIDFNAEDVPEIPVFDPDVNARHDVELNPDYNPFNPSSFSTPSSGASGGGLRQSSKFGSSDVTGWEQLYDSFARGTDRGRGEVASRAFSAELPDDTDTLPDTQAEPTDPAVTGAIQVKGRYIITLSHDGVMVVDQRRAHLNVLYHKFLSEVSRTEVVAQTLLFPETVELAPSESARLEGMLPELRQTGFDLTPLGDNRWQVNALPAAIDDVDMAELLRSLAEQASETEAPGREALHSSMAMAMARAAAVPYGRVMGAKEIEHLLGQLFKLPSPAYLPDGRTVLVPLSTDSLSDLF